ncbi:MAG: hypothetical protein J5831_03265, partial [Bacteroidales bacterium]|nr:hypothetical protein [Bacteroidales bacterium]
VSLDEVVEMTEYTQSICGNCSDVIWGNGIDESLGDEISVTLIATGFESNARTEDRRPKTEDRRPKTEVCVTSAPAEVSTHRTVHQLNETAAPVDTPATEPVKEAPVAAQPTPQPAPEVPAAPETHDETPHYVVHKLDEKDESFHFENPVFKHEPTPANGPVSVTPQPEPTPSEKVFDNPFANSRDDDEGFEFSNFHSNDFAAQEAPVETTTLVMETPKAKTYDPKEELKRNRLRALSLNFKTQKGLEELERQPAYMRRDMNYEEIVPEEEVSRYASTSKGISSENSFLHDNVD